MKKGLKKALCTALVFALTISMCACGKDKDNQGDAGKKNVNAALAKEGVYREKELNFDLGPDYQLLSSCKLDDRVYLLAETYNYHEETGESKMDLYLLSCAVDGSDLQKKTLEVPEFQLPEGVTAPSGNGNNSAGGEIDIMPMPRTATTEAVEEMVVDSNMAVDMADEEPETYFYSYNNVSSAMLLPNKTIVGLRNGGFSYTDNKNPENNASGNGTYLDCWDMEGNLIYDKEIDMQQYQNEESYSYLERIICTKSGKTGLMFSGDTRGIVVVDEEGNVAPMKKLPDEVFQNTAGVAYRNDGTAIVCFYKGEDWSNQYIAIVDLESGAVSNETKLPDSVKNQGMYNIYPGADTDVVFGSSDGVYTYNIGDDASKKMMDYVNSDVDASGFENIVVLDDTHFLASYYGFSMDGRSNRCTSLFSYVKPEDVVEKQVLTLASMYLDNTLKTKIIEFNKTNSDYRIVTRTYDKYNTDDDYMAGYTQLNNDFIGGNAPDIICLEDYGMPISSYIKKGLLADIDKLIQNDEELSKLEYLDNVFEAYRVNGKLYRVVPSFSIQTFCGKRSIFGESKGLTLDSLKQVMQKYPDANLIEMGMDKESLLRQAMYFGASELLDLENGTCNFDSQYFIDLLEFINSQKIGENNTENFTDDDWQEYWNNYELQYRDNKTLLRNNYMYGFSDLKRTYSAVFGEEVSFVGFPTQNGTGSILSAGNVMLGIYAKSSSVEGAWQFVRQFLTKDYQDQIAKGYNGFPVLKSSFMEASKEPMEPSFWYDENGNKVYMEEEEDITWVGNEQVPLKKLTQEQVDRVIDFITSVNTTGYYNEDIVNIVIEEATPFFEGQKKAKDVASIIQGRIKPYVNENM